MAEKTGEIYKWLKELSKSNSSTERDSNMMQNLLRQLFLPNAVVTYGVVYPSGYGRSLSINQMAKIVFEFINIKDEKKALKYWNDFRERY